MKKTQFQLFQRIGWTKEFEDTLQMFIEMIEIDPRINKTINPNNKKKGIFSPAIRFLIKEYVDDNKNAFLAYKQDKISKKKKEDDEDVI